MASLQKNLDWCCERGILLLTLAMLVFAPLAFGAVDDYEWAFLVMEGVGVAIFLLWTLRLWLNPKLKLLWPPLTWVVIAFALYAIGRYFTADIEYVARVEVIKILLFTLIFFVVVNNLHGQDEAQVISFTLITLAVLISGYAVTQLLTHSTKVWNVYSGYPHRAGGTYISPNDLAGFLEMILPLALSYLLVGRVRIVIRILLAYAAVAMMAGLAVTFSRGGWVAAASGIVLLLGILLGHSNHRLRAMLLLLVLLTGGGFCVKHYLAKTAGYTERVTKAVETGPGVLDTDTRLDIWKSANQMWQDNFWLGVGPAHFDYRFSAYRPEEIQQRPGHVHNDYLNLLTDWGTIGGIIVLAGIGIFIFSLAKTWPHARRAENDFGHGQSNRFAFFIGATSGLFALSVHSAVDFNLHIPANALVGVILLALLTSNLRFATGQHWFRVGWLPKLILTATILAITTAFATDEWRRGHETFWLAQANRQQAYSPERSALLQKAFAAEPHNFQTAYDIGECFYRQSSLGGDDSTPLAQQAIDWYAKGIKLNPYDGLNYLGTGICLDWIDQTNAAEKYYQQAENLDPNGYFTMNYIGWHFVQTGDFAAARQYFIRSLKLTHANLDSGRTARIYLGICEAKLTEKASGKPSLPFSY